MNSPQGRDPKTPDSSLIRWLSGLGAHAVALVLILIVGFALRLSQPTLVEFKRDEATIARLGQAIAYEGYLPAVGVDSSLGIDNLPLTLYLASVPLRVWSDPLSLVIFTCLLNGLALLACYALTRASLGRTQALLATLLFAVSPWAVLYARKIWSRTLPLVTLAFAASLWLTFAKRRKWALVGAFVSLAALLGLQLEALAFVPILGLAILLFHDAVAWRPLAVGILVFGVLMLPYAVHDVLHEWENTLGLVGYAGGGGSFSWRAVLYTLSLLGGMGIDGQVGPYHAQFLWETGPFWWTNDVLSGLFALALIYAAVEIVRGESVERRRTFSMLLLWIALPLLLQLRPSAPTQRHYYVMHYPAQHMLMATFVVDTTVGLRRWLAGRGRKRLGGVLLAAGGVCLALYASWQVSVTARLRHYMVVHPTTGGYGVPLRYTREAAKIARSAAREGEVIVLSEETQPMMSETPTVFDALLFGVDHRFADGRAAIPMPQREPVAYLVGPLRSTGTAWPLETPIRQLASRSGLEAGSPLILPDGTGYAIYAKAEGDWSAVTADMTPLAMGIPFANNVVFAAFEAPDGALPGEDIEVWLAWWLRAAPPTGADTHFTVQMLDSSGDLIGQDDHAAFPSDQWRADDLVLSRFVVSIPNDAAPGTYQLRAGMYIYPDIQTVPVVDPVGNPVDDAVTLTDVLTVE